MEETIDPERLHIQENIKKYDCHIILVCSDNYLPGFAYSIGLYEKFDHPEIMCFGLNQEVLHSVLNHACGLVKTGVNFNTELSYPGFLEGYEVKFLNVGKTYFKDYFGYAGWYYHNFDFPAMQIVWPDKASLFPWEEGFYPEWKFKQPLLDRSTDFKLYEERNLGVFTTKYVLEGQPILYAYHNDDGDWQFHSEEVPDIKDCKIVCLEDITKMDPTVNELFDLENGWCAWRSDVNEKWNREEIDGEK